MTTQGQGRSMTLFSVTQNQHFQTSFPPYGASMGCWDEDDLETWYTASGTQALPNLFK